MSARRRTVHASQKKVWEVLSDPWLYPLWVVGATRMRDVEGDWPTPGSRLHHSVGVWPLVTDDTTEALEVDPGRMLRLRARAWPAGEAEVVIRVSAEGAASVVEIHEDTVRGAAQLVPSLVRQPLLDVRNTETLRRLAAIAEHR